MQDELWERNAIQVPTSRVIMTSDETDLAWWADVEALGWVKMDHGKLRTVERFGKWSVSLQSHLGSESYQVLLIGIL